jgi:hypothetical protein
LVSALDREATVLAAQVIGLNAYLKLDRAGAKQVSILDRALFGHGRPVKVAAIGARQILNNDLILKEQLAMVRAHATMAATKMTIGAPADEKGEGQHRDYHSVG